MEGGKGSRVEPRKHILDEPKEGENQSSMGDRRAFEHRRGLLEGKKAMVEVISETQGKDKDVEESISRSIAGQTRGTGNGKRAIT